MVTDVLHALASILQTPVIVLLIALVVVSAVIVGMFIAELFTEHRYFKLSLPRLIDELQETDDPDTVIRDSDMLGRQKNALLELLYHPLATASERESLAVDLVAQEQARYDNRTKLTDLIAKVAPMLGLMGTLIPLGPGIVAIGDGDTALLSQSLLIAFDTTVLGLVVAAVALCVSTVRKSWYTKYMSAFTAAAECVLERANEPGMVERMQAARAARLAAAEEAKRAAEAELPQGETEGLIQATEELATDVTEPLPAVREGDER